MVATVDEIFQIVRTNPFIDGIGYFIEVTTIEAVPRRTVDSLSQQMQEEFCAHAQVTLEGDNVLGFDFHEHLFTRGDEGEDVLVALEGILRRVERDHGLDHLCIEFQFDLQAAKKARHQIDELLRP